jgi:hypothetical protein
MHGGGVFIAYKEDIVASEVKGVGGKCELTVIKVMAGRSPVYIVVTIGPLKEILVASKSFIVTWRNCSVRGKPSQELSLWATSTFLQLTGKPLQ